jgi:SepF-like predicted cell division protein (DUF552 family)
MAPWSWFPVPWGKKESSLDEPIDIERHLKSLSVSSEGFIEKEGVIYIKSINLAKDTAVEETIKELKRPNIVILDMRDIMYDPIELRNRVARVKDFCASNEGDMCRISETSVMVLPKGVEVLYPEARQEG